MFHMKAKFQISRNSPSLYIQPERESIHCTHVYVCIRHRNREDTSAILLTRDSYQITSSTCNTCTKTILPHRNAPYIHLITCCRHIYPPALAFRVLIPCSQTTSIGPMWYKCFLAVVCRELAGHLGNWSM